jgi:hypothetical protein
VPLPQRPIFSGLLSAKEGTGNGRAVSTWSLNSAAKQRTRRSFWLSDALPTCEIVGLRECFKNSHAVTKFSPIYVFYSVGLSRG